MDVDEWVQPTLDQWTQPTVDPEVRAYVSSLVTALGGTSVEEQGRYVLGDDAFAVLKDIRRWIKFYDEKLNRLDVQRILAESNLVKGDLLEILADWPESQTENKLKFKIALGCLELLIPLTWPIEIDDQLMKVNHHRHLPYLRLAQAEYKRAILHHDTAKILRTAVRIGLPSMASNKNDRTPRDEGIIRIMLYFFRNVAVTESPKDIPYDGDEAEVSRSATIDAFHHQDVFQLILTVASSMGDEFQKEDVIVLEVLFHLLKGIDPEKLFLDDQQFAQSTGNEFKEMMAKEKAMLASYKRYAPSRHGRFGTMVWVKRDNEKVTTLTGQNVIQGQDKAFSQMDKSKKWNKPRFRGKQNIEEKPSTDFNKSEALNSSARRHLRRFVEDFLDSSFNPLFQHLRKGIEREVERIQEDTHPMQFYYLISWFLQAECARRRSPKARKERKQREDKKDKGRADAVPSTEEDESFGLVACVLNQETFVLLNRFMQKGQDNKDWKDLNAGMRCFTQILLTVQEMADSPLEEDQEIAENIQNRIFYEETTHDRIITLLRDYKNQGFSYLDACTELAHVFIRMLERYSKENAELQIRSRRRARRKRKAAQVADGSGVVDDAGDVELEDIVEVQRVSSERKFDFARFAARFMIQPCVDTFVCLTKYYNDLSRGQLKRAHRFFYRVAFKNELTTVLFRVDIIQLFNKMIKGPEGLDTSSSAYKEWEELVRQIFRRLVKRLQDRPGLMVEMLFSKIPATLFYLEHGYDREVATNPRPPAELEVKPGMEWDEELGVAVGVLVNQNKSDAIAWVKDILAKAEGERRAWETAEVMKKDAARDEIGGEAGGDTAVPNAASPREEGEEGPKAPAIIVRPDNPERRTAIFKDNKIRLLLTLCGFQRLGEPHDTEATWIIPSSLTSEKLSETQRLINAHEFSPPTYDDEKSAEHFLRSKAVAERTAARRRAAFDDDPSGDDGIDYDEDFEFPAGGPTARKSDVLKELKKKRSRNKEPNEIGDEERARRREAKRLTELEKRRKIKSEMYVHDSDDETDEEKDREFFAREEELRRNAGRNIMKALSMAEKSGAREAEGSKKKRKSSSSEKPAKKRKVTPPSGSHSDPELELAGKATKKQKIMPSFRYSSDVDSDLDITNTWKGQPDDIISISSEASSSSDDDSDVQSNSATGTAEATDTPLSSQPHLPSPAAAKSGDNVSTRDLAADVLMRNLGADAESEDDGPIVRQPIRRRTGFVVESDSE